MNPEGRPATKRADNPPAVDALLDFVAVHEFIHGTKRTRPMLLALVADGKLKATGNRFTAKGKRK